MRTIVIVAISALAFVAGPGVQAESLPLKSVNRANEVIDAAIAAHGGAEALSELKTVTVETRGTNWATGQSRVPGPPYDRNPFNNVNAIDTENEVYYNRASGEAGGYDFSQATMINGDDSWQLNFRNGTATPLAEPDYDTQSGPFIRVTPALLMKQLQARRGQSNWLGETEFEGRKHDVVTLVMEVGPVLALYFDRETHLLTRMERVLPPFGQVEYRFLDYAEVGGIPFNSKFLLLVNGESNLDFDNVNTVVNEPLDTFLAMPGGLQRLDPIEPDTMSVNEIAEGIYLAGGNGTYSLFIELPDSLVALGGTQVVPDALKALREEGVGKPVAYGVVTHHHSDHVPGAATYAAEGATVVAPAAHEAVLREAAGDENAKFEFVTDHMTIGSGDRTVELYNMGPTPHAEHILLAYVPDAGLLFEADHFPMPLNGSIPPAAPATKAFAAALDRLGLEYDMIAGTHSPRTAGPEDVKTALSRTPAQH